MESIFSPTRHRINAWSKRLLNHYLGIFSGEVLSVEISRGVYWAVRVKVERLWKNVESDEVVVFTESPDGASCGVEFAVGETYLVYAASAFDNELWTNHCTRTQKLKYAQKDLRILGTGKRPKLKIVEGLFVLGAYGGVQNIFGT